jgi:peroxiredoxin
VKENIGAVPSGRWRWLLAGLLIGLAAGLVVLFGFPSLDDGSGSSDSSTDQTATRPLVGRPAPPFSSRDSDGNPIALSDYQGRVVLLNFWATWCGPCEVEMPLLQDRYQRWQREGFVVLAVNFDEPREQVEAYGQELNLEFPLVLDPGGHIQQLYEVRGYPSSYLVDREGLIREVHIGLMSESQLDEMLALVGLEG